MLVLAYSSEYLHTWGEAAEAVPRFARSVEVFNRIKADLDLLT